jgi:hypothetical protein
MGIGSGCFRGAHKIWGKLCQYQNIALTTPAQPQMEALVKVRGLNNMTTPSDFSVRQFLRERGALLVHFNTPMSKKGSGFPSDLVNAKNLAGRGLSFSTIQATDRGPRQVGNFLDANAGGSVGIVVDVRDACCVLTVGEFDGGTDFFDDGTYQSGGKPPSAIECARSIDERKPDPRIRRDAVNEWLVKDYVPLGIFVFCPPWVYVRSATEQGERPSSLDEILAIFPEDRTFSNNGTNFLEYDRGASTWGPTTYADIVPENGPDRLCQAALD